MHLSSLLPALFLSSLAAAKPLPTNSQLEPRGVATGFTMTFYSAPDCPDGSILGNAVDPRYGIHYNPPKAGNILSVKPSRALLNQENLLMNSKGRTNAVFTWDGSNTSGNSVLEGGACMSVVASDNFFLKWVG